MNGNRRVTSEDSSVVGVLLAGGQGRCMGGVEKCLLALGGRPLLAHVVDRVRPQVGTLVLNAGGETNRFTAFGLPVVKDETAAGRIEPFAGPLAGLLAGLEWAAEHHPGADGVVSVPTDTPFLPEDLVDRLRAAREDAGAEVACAASDGRVHPVIALWPVAARFSLRKAMVEEGIRRADRWLARFRVATVEYPGEPVDPFFNVNRPEDLAEAERLLKSGLK